MGVGTREAFNAIQTDPQLANRFEPVFLPRWPIGDRLKPETDPYLQLLASFECMLPLNRPSNLTRPALALKILSLSEGLIGEVSAILTKAAVKAIASGKERIDLRLLEEIQFTPPSDRKWRADGAGGDMIETDEISFTGTLWPVHVKPQEDELLSSWLARLSLAHGQTVAPFTSRVWPGCILVARDVDLWNDPGMFEALCIKTGTPCARAFAATLASYEGWLLKPRQCHLPWTLPRR